MPTLSERLQSSASVKDMAYRLVPESDVLEAAAELDRREAVVAAAEAWAKAYRVWIDNANISKAQALGAAEDALLAALKG